MSYGVPTDKEIPVIGLSDQPQGVPPLILASGSPRRRDLLKAAGLSFDILSPEVEELQPGTLTPRELSLTNARLKANTIAQDHPDALVIGSDTVVALDGQVYGKPAHLDEARENLRRFRGRIHEVMSGVSLSLGKESVDFVETSYVKFRDFSDDTIEEYLSKVHVLDKAGGYAIQDYGDMIVDKIEGDYDNIVGLPVAKVLDQLRVMGFPVPS